MNEFLIHPATERQEPIVTLHDVTSALRRHGRWVLSATLVSAVVVAAVLSQTPRKYEGTATLMLDLRQPMVANLQGNAPPQQPATVDPAVLRSEVKLLRSEPVAREVIENLHLDQVPEFRRVGLLQTASQDVLDFAESIGIPARETIRWLGEELGIGGDKPGRPKPDGALDALLRTYGKRLTIGNDGRSYLIDVSFLSEDPVLSAQVANAHIAAYLRWQTDTKRDMGRAASSWINEELETLGARVQAAEEAVQKFREANQIYATGTAVASQAAPYLRGDTSLAQRLAELNSQLSLVTTDHSAREARLEQARTLVRRGDPDRVTEVSNSSLIQRLREQEAAVSRREAELRSRFGPRHPDIMTVQSELRDLRGGITSEIQRVLESLSNDVRVSGAREADLRAEIALLEQRSVQTSRAEIRMRELEREASVIRTLHENLLTQRQIIAVQQGILQSDVRVVSLATVPTRPTSPNVLLSTLVAAAVVGLFLSVIAFVREFTFRGIKSMTDLEFASGLPCLGAVPLLPRRVARSGRPADAMGIPQSLFADSVRTVRAAVSLPKTLLITSSMLGEGKSTLAIALGRSLSLAGYRVLLIDADLRHPSVAAAMGDTGGEGWLNDVLDAGKDSGTAWPRVWPVRVEDWSGLHYLPSRNKAGTAPQDLLASAAMHGVLERAAHEYDVVLVDSPPILVVSDALILAPQTEATLLVAQWRRTPRNAVSLAVSRISRAGGRLIGAVLNQVDMKKTFDASERPDVPWQDATAVDYGALRTHPRNLPQLPARRKRDEAPVAQSEA